MCLNPKVLAGLAAVGVGVYVFAPHLFAAALPLLLLAACPLSMVLMMAAMGKMGGSKEAGPAETQPQAESTEALEARLRALEAQHTALEDQLQAHARNEGAVPGRDRT